MVKKLTSKQQKEQLNNLFAVYNKRLGRLYSDYVKKLFSLGYDESVLDDDALFSFDKFPKLTTRLNDIFSDYFQNNILCYKNGITDGVALAYNHDNAVLGGFSILSDKALRTARNIAAETFISNRLNSKQGLNLAQTVWNYCQQTKSEFEMAMSNVIADGLGKGTSAEEIGKAIRKYLNNPDIMYRRYHTIKIQKNGQKKDVVTWRRKRIIDGKVRFVEEPLEKVGMGVYRSSRKNALRVARTEINAAYHKARNERWENEPFVIGQLIHLSPQHDIDDICDELEGRYPKDFIWTGWHPQCMCTSDPILISGDEAKDFYNRLYAGEDMSNYVSPYTITDIPENYKRYIRDNVSDIIKAKKCDKLAWHLADNTKYWHNLLNPAERTKMGLKSISSRDAILEAARIRHAKRTPEQIEKIQNRWNKHRHDYYKGLVQNLYGGKSVAYIHSKDLFKRYNAIRRAIEEKKDAKEVATLYQRFEHGYQIRSMWIDRKIAINVLKTAQKYGEADISQVQTLLQTGNYQKAREAAKTLAKNIKAIQLDEASLSKLIPDVNEWHKKFTSKELHEVYDAVESKLLKWQELTLEQKQKKLEFEAIDFLGGNMHGVQSKYATWEVSQAAYLKKLEEVKDAIDWANIGTKFADIKNYKTQSKIYHKMVHDLENAIKAKDKTLAQELLQDSEDKKNSLIKLKLKRATKAKDGSIPYDGDAYSQARKDAAVWAKDTKTADDVLREKCGEVWRNATEAEKDAIYGYTSSYSNINEPLRGLTYYGSEEKAKLGRDRIPLIESIINKSTYDKDIWLQRGGGMVELKKFGLSNYDFASEAEVKALLGKTGTEGAFTSAGVAKGKGFGGDVILNIYAPRGTKMMYAEPYSAYGDGAGRLWDGIKKQMSFSSESEIILQRGTTFRITKIERSGGRWYVDVDVINQDTLPFPYVDGYPYK